MLRPTLLLLTLGLLAAGCQGIQRSAPTSPRVEAEVRVLLDPSLQAGLAEEGTSRSLEATVNASVLAVADMGLRLYAVPSEAYGKADAPAPYELVLRVENFQTRLGERKVAAGEAGTASLDQIDEIGVQVSAVLSKRRPQGPALVLGMSRATGRVATKSDPAVVALEASFSSRTIANDAKPERISVDDLAEVVREAATKALARLVDPLDRELARTDG